MGGDVFKRRRILVLRGVPNEISPNYGKLRDRGGGTRLPLLWVDPEHCDGAKLRRHCAQNGVHEKY